MNSRDINLTKYIQIQNKAFHLNYEVSYQKENENYNHKLPRLSFHYTGGENTNTHTQSKCIHTHDSES